MIPEIISDETTMTVAVGTKVYRKPELSRRKEWDFGLKNEILGTNHWGNAKETNKIFTQLLGPKFNLRFFAANYWLWIGNRMTVKTGNMLRYDGRYWQPYDASLVLKANAVLPYINEAERDGLYNLIPAIIAHGDSPQAIRAKVGRGVWRRIATNSTTRNWLIMKAALRTRHDPSAAYVRLLDFPSGVLPAVRDGGDPDETVAARLTPKKQVKEFNQTLDTVLDTRRMMGIAFNDQWGLARIKREHELATKALILGRYPAAPFCEDWSFEKDGFTATLLTSQADIAVEGQTQHHCVASYAHMAADHKYLVFKVDGKERATIGAYPDGRVQQVYCAYNEMPSAECKVFALTRRMLIRRTLTASKAA